MTDNTFHNSHYRTGASDGRSPEAELSRLLDVMAQLRDPATGCPWDQVQTFETIAPYTIEEAYEVADAITRRDMAQLPDELGDLLFQVVYHARMAEEAGLFGFGEVARVIADKMIRRHPQLFPGTAGPRSADWESGKRAERQSRSEHRVLDGISANLPSLTQALKITARVGRIGFDWPDAESVILKLEEEIAEVRAELADRNPVRLADEVGDVLFVVANLARKLGLDPERCLRDANAKFTCRFNAVEEALASRGLTPADASLPEMEAEWIEVKARECR